MLSPAMVEDLAHRLAQCTDDSGRLEVWQAFVQDHEDELAEGTQKASQLILAGDIAGLRAHLSQDARQRAEAHVARLRAPRRVLA